MNDSFAHIAPADAPADVHPTSATPATNNAPAGRPPTQAGDDTNRTHATVAIAAAGTLPALDIPLVHEFPDVWKLDVPDTLDGQRLHDNLIKHLTLADEAKDAWPADANDGYRLIVRHVLAAVFEPEAAEPPAGGGSESRRQGHP